jgi:hypothetical protein
MPVPFVYDTRDDITMSQCKKNIRSIGMNRILTVINYFFIFYFSHVHMGWVSPARFNPSGNNRRVATVSR